MNLTSILTDIAQAMIYVLLGTGCIWLSKKLDDYRTRDFDDDVHIDNGNLAVGLRRAGLYLAAALALSGTMTGGASNENLLLDFLQLVLDALMIIGFLFASRFINDTVMLYGISNDSECIREFIDASGQKRVGNTAVGIVEACMYIATGLILRGSFMGDGGSFVQSLLSALLFFVLGQVVLLLFGLIYQLITPFDVREEIKKNNPAAALGLGGVLISLSIVVMSSIAGPFTGWINDIENFSAYAFGGMVLLILFRSFMDRIVLPTTRLAVEVKEDQNVAALLVVESTLVALAILIATSI